MFAYLGSRILHKYLHSLRVLCTGNKPYKIVFEHSFSSDEECAILKELNVCSVEDLSRFSITDARSRKLVAHRKKMGEFENLNDVLSVEGFGAKILKTLCLSILNPPAEYLKQAKKLRNYNHVSPEVSPGRTANMEHVVSVSLSSFSISWCGMSVSDRQVYSWGQRDLALSREVKRHNEVHILEAGYDAHSHLPMADTYVMESCVVSGALNQSGNFSVNQQNLQISTILLVLLNQISVDEPFESRVYFLKKSLWCRLYGTLIGNERVSASNVVEDVLGGSPGCYNSPKVPDDLVAKYYDNDSLAREDMCAALLLNMCFLDVCVKPIPECLKILRSRARPK